MTEDWEAATEEERLRALPFIFATFKLFENAWFQRQQGTLGDEQWQGWDATFAPIFIAQASRPGGAVRHPAFASGFRSEHLEGKRNRSRR